MSKGVILEEFVNNETSLEEAMARTKTTLSLKKEQEGHPSTLKAKDIKRIKGNFKIPDSSEPKRLEEKKKINLPGWSRLCGYP